MGTLTTTLQESEREVERLEEEKTELWKGVELHKRNMMCLQPMVGKLSETVGELELERDRLTMALTEMEKKKQELSTTVGELELEQHRLTMVLTEQEREVERLKKEKKEIQEAMKARQSHTQLNPEVDKLSETLSEWDSSLQELICKIKPHHQKQKEVIVALLQQRLEKGDTWYLVDVRWMKQWKKYVGYDQDQSHAGLDSAYPWPIDNSNLFQDHASGTLKDNLKEERHYSLLPEPAWFKMLVWFGLSKGSQPIARRVVESGLHVAVYLLEFKLSMHNSREVFTRQFSRASTVADLEAELRSVFSVPQKVECRVWHRYMTTYKLLRLTTPTLTLEDAGLYNGQTIVLEKRNKDGSWPRKADLSIRRGTYRTRSTDSTDSTA